MATGTSTDIGTRAESLAAFDRSGCSHPTSGEGGDLTCHVECLIAGAAAWGCPALRLNIRADSRRGGGAGPCRVVPGYPGRLPTAGGDMQHGGAGWAGGGGVPSDGFQWSRPLPLGSWGWREPPRRKISGAGGKPPEPCRSFGCAQFCGRLPDFNASAKCHSALFSRVYSSNPVTARVRGKPLPVGLPARVIFQVTGQRATFNGVPRSTDSFGSWVAWLRRRAELVKLSFGAFSCGSSRIWRLGSDRAQGAILPPARRRRKDEPSSCTCFVWGKFPELV